MKTAKYFIALCCIPTIIWGQTPDQSLEYEIESIAEGNEENNTDLTQWAEDLEDRKNNPILINFAEESDLESLKYLDIFQINNLIQYRNRTGVIYSPYELMAVKGFDKNTIQKLEPYLNFAPKPIKPNLKLKNIVQYSRHEIILRNHFDLEKREGYITQKDNQYLGDPINYYLRYKIKYSNFLSFGITAQQDAGEPFGKPYQKAGIDYISAHLALTNYGALKKLIIGDYQANFGQGLALWTNLAFGKSAQTTDIKRYAQGIRKYSGADENRFLRGTAITYRFLKKLDISAFYSSKKIDANVSDVDSNNTPSFVSSLQTTGLHRNTNEISDKHANTLKLMGANLNYNGNPFSVGFTAVNYQLETPLENSSRLYQKFRFSGKTLTNLSFDFNYIYKDLNLFGEIATSSNYKTATSIGFQSKPADQIHFTLLYRFIDKEYQFLYNAPFSESGSYGEQGTYLGWLWDFNKTFKWAAYVDIYQFSWLRYNANAPSKGIDILNQLNITFSSWFNIYLRLKSEKQEVNNPSENTITPLVWQQKTSFRIHASYAINTQIKMASRIERSFYTLNNKTENGFVLFQDIKYILKKFPLDFILRYAIIDTRSFDTRIYAYENDLLYSFSIPPYYGESTRFYILSGWEITPKIKFQAKYSISKFYDRDEISSGLNRIDGNTISNLRFQLRIKF